MQGLRPLAGEGMRGMRGIGDNGFTLDANSTPYLVSGAPAGCPLLSNGACGSPQGWYSCALVRECDPITGMVHTELTLPSGNVANANIWSYNPTTGTYTWLGPNGTPATPPPGETVPTSAPSGMPLPTTNWFQTWAKQQGTLTAATSGTPAPVSKPTPAPATPTPVPTPVNSGGTNNAASGNKAASGNPSTTTNNSSTLIPGIPDTDVYIGGALLLAAIFFMHNR